MLWALSLTDGKKMEVSPNARGLCPNCREKVFAKCGEINVWHWAHFTETNCDSWYESESFWHKHWKMAFGMDNTEVRIEKDGKFHIADIYTNEQVVIELQNSPIPKPVIRERELFYGERMIWLINGEKFKQNLTPTDIWEDEDYRFIRSLPRPPVKYKRLKPEILKGPNGEFFKWSSPRRSWIEVQRPVFIDFGQDTLFIVHEGMGTKQIRGKYIPKEKFFKKYGGDYEVYVSLENH